MDKKFCVDYNLATRHRLNTVTVIPDTSHSPQLVALSALRSAYNLTTHSPKLLHNLRLLGLPAPFE
jgi:hypothetical protein